MDGFDRATPVFRIISGSIEKTFAGHKYRATGRTAPTGPRHRIDLAHHLSEGCRQLVGRICGEVLPATRLRSRGEWIGAGIRLLLIVETRPEPEADDMCLHALHGVVGVIPELACRVVAHTMASGIAKVRLVGEGRELGQMERC